MRARAAAATMQPITVPAMAPPANVGNGMCVGLSVADGRTEGIEELVVAVMKALTGWDETAADDGVAAAADKLDALMAHVVADGFADESDRYALFNSLRLTFWIMFVCVAQHTLV